MFPGTLDVVDEGRFPAGSGFLTLGPEQDEFINGGFDEGAVDALPLQQGVGVVGGCPVGADDGFRDGFGFRGR